MDTRTATRRSSASARPPWTEKSAKLFAGCRRSRHCWRVRCMWYCSGAVSGLPQAGPKLAGNLCFIDDQHHGNTERIGENIH